MIDNKVREYRLQNHLSQKELACRVGTRRETIGALEKGKHNPSLNWLSGLPENWMYL